MDSNQQSRSQQLLQPHATASTGQGTAAAASGHSSLNPHLNLQQELGPSSGGRLVQNLPPSGKPQGSAASVFPSTGSQNVGQSTQMFTHTFSKPHKQAPTGGRDALPIQSPSQADANLIATPLSGTHMSNIDEVEGVSGLPGDSQNFASLSDQAIVSGAGRSSKHQPLQNVNVEGSNSRAFTAQAPPHIVTAPTASAPASAVPQSHSRGNNDYNAVSQKRQQTANTSGPSRKFKDGDSSPGLPFRSSQNHASQQQSRGQPTDPHSQSLRQTSNQKVFSNSSQSSSALSKRNSGAISLTNGTIPLGKANISGLASGARGVGGPSAYINDMHKTNLSPSKAAKYAHLTHQKNSQLSLQQHQQLQHTEQINVRAAGPGSGPTKKNSSRNSTNLIASGVGASTGNKTVSLTQHLKPHEETAAQLQHSNTSGHPQKLMISHPTSNINSIVMQTSPAKFFQGVESTTSALQQPTPLSGSKNTGALKQEVAPTDDAGLMTYSPHFDTGGARGTSAQESEVPLRNQGPSNNQGFGQATSGGIQTYQGGRSQTMHEKPKQPVFNSASQGGHQNLFQPPVPLQQKGKTASMGNVQVAATSQQSYGQIVTPQPLVPGKTYKHYSQVTSGGVNGVGSQSAVAMQSSKLSGTITKSEKKNSMTSLSMTQPSSQSAVASQANQAYGGGANFTSSLDSKRQGLIQHSSGGLKPPTQSISLVPNNSTFSHQRASASPVSTAQFGSESLQAKTLASGKQSHGVPKSSTLKDTRAGKKDSSIFGKQSKRSSLNLNSDQSFMQHQSQTLPGPSQSQLAQNSGRQPAPRKQLWKADSSSLSEEHFSFPSLSKYLLRSLPQNRGAEQRLQGNKSGVSLLHTSLSQIVTPSLSGQSAKSMTKRSSNFVSPRQSGKQSQIMTQHTLPSSQDQPSIAESALSDEIRNVKLDLKNQNVVKADTERARFVSRDLHDQLQALITYLCKQEGFSYKQGINDVVAPFLWLAAQKQQLIPAIKPTKVSSVKKQSTKVQGGPQQEGNGKGQLDLEEPYIMAREFIRTFQTNLFVDDEFYALQSCLALLKMLLTYHDPQLVHYLEFNGIITEMYSIPWFITYFASRITSAELVLAFWDRVAKDASTTFILFFAVALVTDQRERVLKTDPADLPTTMTALQVDNQAQLSKLIKLAEEIEANTPYSFKQLDQVEQLFSPQSTESLKTICQGLQAHSCMPLLPAELFFYSFPGEIDCPNPECANSLTHRKDKTGEYLPLLSRARKNALFFDVKKKVGFMKSISIEDSDEKQQMVARSEASGLSSFAAGTGPSSSSSSLVNQARPIPKSNQLGRSSNSSGMPGGHPLETESNLNYEADHQESPIDLINETAKMKHLSQEDFKVFAAAGEGVSAAHSHGGVIEADDGGCGISLGGGALSVDHMVALSSQQHTSQGSSAAKVRPGVLPELCLKCVQRQRVMQKLEEKRQAKRLDAAHQLKLNLAGATANSSPNDEKAPEDSSFEDLSSDLLYSKFRLMIVDCRLNSLQQEVSLPHCLTFEVIAASKAQQLKEQIKSLQDYKDSYHICLLGLDKSEDSGKEGLAKAASRQSDKISIRQFHEYVLRFLVAELLKQGFRYVSTLPGGFQQVHDLATVYGFQLIDHDDQHRLQNDLKHDQQQASQDAIDTPITVALTSCYHCHAQKSRRQLIDSQSSIVVKKYGSMINTLGSQTFGQVDPIELALEPKDKSMREEVTPLALVEDDSVEMGDKSGTNTSATLVQESTQYQGEKFDLTGFSDYFPFGLKHVYEAASSLNQMLQASNANSNNQGGQDSMGQSEEQKKSKQAKGGNTHNSAGHQLERSDNVVEVGHGAGSGGFGRINAITRSRYRQINIQPGTAVQRQQSTESAYVGHKHQPLTGGTNGQHVFAGPARSAGKSSGSACRKTATQQNQQHLQLQSNYKLMSKVPDFKSQFLTDKDGNAFNQRGGTFSGHNHAQLQNQSALIDPSRHDRDSSIGEANQAPQRFSQILASTVAIDRSNVTGRQTDAHRMGSPIRRNRPRITNEVQSQDKDIAQMLRQMQVNKQKGDQFDQSGSITADKLSRVGTGSEFKSPDTARSSEQPQNVRVDKSGVKADLSSYSGANSLNRSQLGGQSVVGYAASSHASDSTVVQENLPVLHPTLESYLLNGIVAQAPISEQNYHELLSRYEKGHLFTATRLPARKRTFQLRSQLSFHYYINSTILITPFTVAIIQKVEDIARAKKSKDLDLPRGCTQNDFAVFQSRFFMYDLIKITSRKSTTKIITFYYRIPKKVDYDETILEEISRETGAGSPQIIWKLNKKPACSYQFAFKRNEFEEVSMSFEFDREEEAKECINSVSSLYKQLKDSQKKSNRRTGPQTSNNHSSAQGVAASGQLADSSRSAKDQQMRSDRNPKVPQTAPSSKNGSAKPKDT